MTRIFILAAVLALAACAPDPSLSQDVPGSNGTSPAAGGATGGTPIAVDGGTNGGSAGGPGVSTPALPPGFDPTKTGVQSGVWPDGRPWIIVVDVPWWL